MNVAVEMLVIREHVRFEVERKCRDIIRRLDLDIYATPQDITIDQLWADLRELQDKENATLGDYGGMFAIVDEIEKRGHGA